MKPARIVLLVVALVAGGLAAYLATRGAPAPDPVIAVTTEVIEEPRTQVLVANQPIGVGQRLAPDLVQWQAWPVGAVRSEYLTSDALPDAPESMSGTVARFEFFPGEPILEAKLVRSDQGYMSAVIPEGMRAVSIAVTAESASGGFIVPNDRVDVVLTRATESGQVSETILANVKALAIGKRLGETGTTGAPENPEDPSSQVFDSAIATLLLTPQQSETVINAASVGRLSLALRSVTDFAENGAEARRAAHTIRLIRGGRDGSVTAATVEPPVPPPSSSVAP